TVGGRWWPVELHVGMAEVEEALSIASLDRAKDLEHHLDVFACTHACLISSRGEHRRCWRTHPVAATGALSGSVSLEFSIRGLPAWRVPLDGLKSWASSRA